jgi:formate hydrogenlyase subunit 4
VILDTLIALAILVVAPPFLLGVINRTKAVFAGRRGPPLLQVYYDLDRLARKQPVYSRTTTWIFRAAPIVILASTLVAGLLVPVAGRPAPLHFTGDVILLAYLLGLARFFMVLGAMDTGSSFEGMGASREVTFGSLAEPAFFAGLLVLSLSSGSLSLSEMLGAGAAEMWGRAGPALVLVAVSFMILLLAENCRIPVDDPNTHLELTMIHEVMVLDHSGPDLAFILHGAAVKLFLFTALVGQLVVPTGGLQAPWSLLLSIAAMIALAVAVGCVESCMARLRLVRLPSFLGGALVLSVVALAVFFTLGDPR